MNSLKIDIEYVKSRLSYEPETWRLIWLKKSGSDRFTRSWNSKWAGKTAGKVSPKAHNYVKLGGHRYLFHRLAWAIFHSTDDFGLIDHADGDPSNNRISNLREADQSLNRANQTLRSDNTSGFKGVSKHRRKEGVWVAKIQMRGKSFTLGEFLSPSEASEAYKKKANELFGEFALHNRPKR